jgi:hypothetical protein
MGMHTQKLMSWSKPNQNYSKVRSITITSSRECEQQELSFEDTYAAVQNVQKLL